MGRDPKANNVIILGLYYNMRIDVVPAVVINIAFCSYLPLS